MHLFPEKIDLDELIGQQVTMVCVGPYDAQIKFENGFIIQSFFKLEGEEDGNTSLWFHEKWIDSSTILNFVNQQVIAVTRASDRQLRIDLANNRALLISTEDSPHECINIILPAGELEIY